MNTPIEETSTKPVKRYVTIPNDQVNTASVALFVATNWRDKPEFNSLNLSQISAADFVILAQRLSDNISQKRNLVGNYSQHTKQMREFAAEISENGKVLKSYLFEKFKKQATEHYTNFGFIHKNTAYILPRDYDNMAQVLRTICDKINSSTYAFIVSKTYGKTYWEDTRDKFQIDWNTSRQQAADLATLTKLINDDLVTVKKILTLLRRRIKDDYSPNHESVYRSIGLLKESF